MYSRTKVNERLEVAAREFSFTPEPQSVENVTRFERYLADENKYVYDDVGKPSATQNLSDFDRAWILNEQVMVQCDAEYALTRYGYVKDEEGIIRRFDFRIAQRLLYDIICDLEDHGASIEIMVLKARQLGMCLDPETKVLTADLQWKTMDEVQVGEELISVDENPTRSPEQKRHQARKMRTSKVEGKTERIHDTLELTLSTGAKIIATPEHPFLCKRRGNSETEWRRSGEIRVGDSIRRVTDVWGASDMEDAWLGGLIDGEGCLRRKTQAGTELSIAQVAGPVLDRARDLVTARYGPAHEEVDNRKPGDSSKLGSKVVHKLVINRSDVLFRILGKTRPTRFISYRWWENKELPGKRVGNGWAIVTAVRPIGKRRVVNIQTTTGTFVAEGVVSHNTTVVQLLIAMRIIFSYGVTAVIGSADQSKTSEMSNMLLFAYDMLPCWLRPQFTSRVESDRGKLMFGGLNSGVRFQHGAQKLGIATGSTPTAYHLSEVALYTDHFKLIDEGLWKAVHASPRVLGILESTGRGNTGWWAETWHYSKSHWPNCRMCPLFLPWFCGIEMYPKPADIRMKPIPPNWIPDRDTRLHVAKAQLYVRSNAQLRKYLGADYVMPLTQQWYWEWNHKEAKYKGGESSFFQEMAGDDEEALQRSTESAFGHETIQIIEANRKLDYATYTITGQSIEAAHEVAPEYYDYTRERLLSRYVSPGGDKSYRWELIPLRAVNAESSPEDIDSVLVVFHPPQPGVNYSIGVDTSEGKGLDSTVISVWALGYRGQPDVQCAEFASAYVNHVEAFAFVMAISALYAQHMALGSTKWREPYVSIEQVAAVGDTCQLQMQKMGYRNFHKMPRYDGSLRRIRRQKQGQSAKMGWYTFTYTRSLLTGNFVHSAQTNWMQINSPWLIAEMKEWEVHETQSGREKLEHAEGEHDDRIFAAAMATFCPHDTETLTERSKKRIEEPSALPPLDLSRYGGPAVPYDSVFGSGARALRQPLDLSDILYMQDSLRKFSG